jgi:hypothetical protein
MGSSFPIVPFDILETLRRMAHFLRHSLRRAKRKAVMKYFRISPAGLPY